MRCVYVLGTRFPDVMRRKFRLLDDVVPHLIVLTRDMVRAASPKPVLAGSPTPVSDPA